MSWSVFAKVLNSDGFAYIADRRCKVIRNQDFQHIPLTAAVVLDQAFSAEVSGYAARRPDLRLEEVF